MTDTTLPLQVPSFRERLRAFMGPGPVPWLTVAVLAVLLAYTDGFVLTSLQGAVGAIERSQGPFASWLRDSTFMLPVFLLAVLAALALARRRLGPALHRARKVLAAGLLIVAAGTLVGVAEVAASAAYDYQLQSAHLEVMHSAHATGSQSGEHLHHQAAAGTCTGLCATQKHATLVTDVRAVGYASGVLLAANAALVGWVVAMRGGRLDASTRRRADRTPNTA